MTDTMTPEERSRCMAAIKGRDTKPEMIVRKYLFSRGLRFRVQVRKLPGTPDVVLPKYRTAVFVNGCFWHGHEGCRYFRMPKSNVDFWRAKIERNVARDSRDEAALVALGWRVVRVWECEVRSVARRRDALDALYAAVVGAGPAAPRLPADGDMPAAAEPAAPYGDPDPGSAPAAPPERE